MPQIGDSQSVFRTLPVRTAHLNTCAEMPIHFGEGEILRMAVIPSGPQKGPGFAFVGERLRNALAQRPPASEAGQ
jgi:hypothetical protein